MSLMNLAENRVQMVSVELTRITSGLVSYLVGRFVG
jgi:hypothetical protein